MSQRHDRRGSRKSRGGQALVEAGLVIGLFIVVVLGMVEFGYAFMALNVITEAATAGARTAAALQVGSRGTCGQFVQPAATNAVDAKVRQAIGNIATVPSGGVTVTQNPDPTVQCSGTCCTFTGSNIPTVTVSVNANLPLLFGLLSPTARNFTRAVTFRDEGR